MRKMQFLMVRSAEADARALDALLLEEARRLTLVLGGRSRVATAVEGDPVASTAHGGVTETDRFSAVLDLTVPETLHVDRVVESVLDLGARLTGAIDAGQSSAMVGIEHVIVPGEAAVMGVEALHRLPGLSPSEFHDHWLHVHGPLGARISGLAGYQQLHTSYDDSRALAAGVGFGVCDLDGASQGYFRSVEHLRQVMATPELAQDALLDEASFVDHARTSVSTFRFLFDSALA